MRQVQLGVTQAQDRAGRELARWWLSRPEVDAVLHPALPGSPGHEHWQALCTRAAGLFAVRFAAAVPRDRVHAFVDALRLFRIGYSWAGPRSLAVPYDLKAMRTDGALKGHLVRFSIGLEEAESLRADIEQSLKAAFA